MGDLSDDNLKPLLAQPAGKISKWIRMKKTWTLEDILSLVFRNSNEAYLWLIYRTCKPNIDFTTVLIKNVQSNHHQIVLDKKEQLNS